MAVLGGYEKVAPKKIKKFKEQKRFKPDSHQDAVLSLHVNRLAPNILASGSADSTTKVWDLEVCACL